MPQLFHFKEDKKDMSFLTLFSFRKASSPLMLLRKSPLASSHKSSFSTAAFAHPSKFLRQRRPTSTSIQANPLLQQQLQQHLHPVAVQTRMATSLGGGSGILPEYIASMGPIKAVGSLAGIFSLVALLRYRNAIKRRIRLVREESWIFGAGVTMERVDLDHKEAPKGVFRNLQLMEMNPEFAANAKKEGHQLISLGDYMASLRPKGLPKKISVEDTPKIIQREIEAGLAAGLLKVLGPNLGRALLPAIGGGIIQRKAQGLAANIATKWVMTPEGSISESQDKAGIPISLLTLLAISDTNAKINSGKPMSDESVPNLGLNATDKMKVGEIVKGPTFVNNLSDTSLIPNDFVISLDFDKAIFGMEDILAGHEEHGDMTETALKVAQEDAIQKEEHHKDAQAYRAQKINHKYDPEDQKTGEPVPVNPRLFPGLYLGWGGALNSHNKREVLKMRLLSLLLNRLGANYYRQTEGEDEKELFQVRMKEGDAPITKPADLTQALMDSGHKIEVVPTSRMTTFGMALCVNEKDGSWSNIPLGVFLETGYEDKDGNMAPAMVPHSGLDMFITGPLAGERKDGTPSELRLQHFVGVEGFCGWHAHANPKVPFNESVERGARLSGNDAIRAARIAGLYANILNGLATEMELPYGGYGLTAVCNDSAALVQHCLYGVNTIYPMTSVGRFMMRSMRYAKTFQDKLKATDPSLDDEVKELTAIIDAMKEIPSDLNASPSSAHSAATRLLATLQPKVPLVLMKDSKNVMESILEEDTMAEAKDTIAHAKTEHVKRVLKEKETVNGSQ